MFSHAQPHVEVAKKLSSVLLPTSLTQSPNPAENPQSLNGSCANGRFIMIHLNYPLVIYCTSLLLKIAHRNSELSHEKWWIFPSFLVCLPDRVCGFFSSSPISVEHPNSWIHKKNPPRLSQVDTTSKTFLEDLSCALKERKVEILLANTIMSLGHAGSYPYIAWEPREPKGAKGNQREPRDVVWTCNNVTSAHSWMVGMTLHLGTVTNVTRDGSLGLSLQGMAGMLNGMLPQIRNV